MKYFLIAGEASGDLHAAQLMRAILQKDADAQFQFYGGDQMASVAGTLLRHYKDIAYMGFVRVVLHARTILRAMADCKHAIVAWHPDAVILVDYPGFNLSIARYLSSHTSIPIYYYILPKAWAWKEGRVRQIREYTHGRLSILPFEVPFFEQKHQCPIQYVGNPSVDEVAAFCEQYQETKAQFLEAFYLPDKPLIALLPGSRVQEISANLPAMAEAISPFLEKGYQTVIVGAPDLSDQLYQSILAKSTGTTENNAFPLVRTTAFRVLNHAEIALVTSGTATLETALLRVPQVVCYSARPGRIIRALKPYFLKVKYISLVNLILDKPLVRELIGDEVNPTLIRAYLTPLLKGGRDRQTMLDGYEEMIERLGAPGAPKRAADWLIQDVIQRSKK